MALLTTGAGDKVVDSIPMTVPMTPLGSITHVIAGLPTAGSGTRVGPVFDPVAGVQQAEVRLA